MTPSPIYFFQVCSCSTLSVLFEATSVQKSEKKQKKKKMGTFDD